MIKKLIIQFLSKIGCLLLKLRGVRTGTGVILSGLPRIKNFRELASPSATASPSTP
ncbi:hypothetical protein ABFY27_15700 [Akkermansia massiliensis]